MVLTDSMVVGTKVAFNNKVRNHRGAGKTAKHLKNYLKFPNDLKRSCHLQPLPLYQEFHLPGGRSVVPSGTLWPLVASGHA